jgi:hypothetical protein
MTTLMIKDLHVNEELDCQTMSAITGGSSLLEWFGYTPESGGSIGKKLDDTLHGTISNMG